ncbi:hypothetical protein EJ08DRAFT_666377 [Tothia fuscella]|uniref:Glycan binding protein Y3-like domain-containing protein n=1 Tax=Tothia fuscella TaxID=1048955 RepID=A0A9P4NEX0_9PEZI|nr:hypothetical protein EJ08DRAFT_666377 [Tothia fuscella]
MHSSFKLLLLSIALVSASPIDNLAPPATNSTLNPVSAQGCYSGGERWANDRAYALQQAQAFCNDVGRGNYYAGESRPKCYNLSSNKKVNFVLSLLSTVPGRYIDAPECYDGMIKEINGCDNGGDTTYTNWRYIADPNAGNC